MNVNDFSLRKTALLFFDILNGYLPASEPGKPRVLKPWIQNAVRLSKQDALRGCPSFSPKAIIVRTMPPPRCFSPTPTIHSHPGRRAK
jgi:hypothetical protein